MVEDLVILPNAERDLDEAYAWYEGRDSGLGDEFLRCIDVCLLAIRRTPEAFAPVRRDYRRALVRRFPYAVFYKFTGDTVVVHAVLHGSQDPQKWRARLP